MDFFTYEVIAVIVIAWLILYPILLYIDWYQWWNKYDPKRQYRCFSPVAISYYKNNAILYWIYNYLLTPGPNQFKYDWWVIFIGGIISGEAVEINTGGLCTPRTLCHSLVPDSPPYTFFPGIGQRWPQSESEWKPVIMSWLGFTTVPTEASGWNPNSTTWNVRDNFLATWGIPPTSPAVIGFITGNSTFNGDKIWPGTLNPLLGLFSSDGLNFGGWFGFLQQGGNFGGFELLEAQRAIWSTEPIPQRIQNAQNNAKKCSAASIVSGAVGTGMGGAFAGAALGTELAPGVGTIIGLLIGVLAGGAMGAWGGNCF